MSTAARVHALVEPILADLGLDLYDLEVSGGVIRVTVDRNGGVDLEAITSVTRMLSRELDHADLFPGQYTLEVTSPGLERVLRTPDHYERATGSLVAIKLVAGAEGERRLEGVLVSASENTFVVRTEAEERIVEYRDVERARTVFKWEATPKPGRSPRAGVPARAGAVISEERS